MRSRDPYVQKKARAVGFNHVALELGDIDEALAFYGRLFEFELGSKCETSTFIDLGPQFLALPPTTDSQWAGIRQLYFFMIMSAQQHVHLQSPLHARREHRRSSEVGGHVWRRRQNHGDGPGLGQLVGEDQDEDQVVDAENDFHHHQGGERQPRIRVGEKS